MPAPVDGHSNKVPTATVTYLSARSREHDLEFQIEPAERALIRSSAHSYRHSSEVCPSALPTD